MALIAGARARRPQSSASLPRNHQLNPRRFFHPTNARPIWYVALGLGGVGLYVGTRYILRAQERMRRRREGLPVDNDEDSDGDNRGSPRRQIDRILGLDFGTKNLRLATASVLDVIPPRVIENAEGLRAIPAAVAVENETVLVGALAKALQGRKPGYTATATRLLLQDELASESLLKTLPYRVDQSGDERSIVLDDKPYSAEWAAEVMLDYVHDMAARSLGDDNENGYPAILAVPAGVTESQRSVLERVAVTAGFDLVSSVEEPIAALHAVEQAIADQETDAEFKGAFSGKTSGPIAVFDMGGYVSSFTVLERRDTAYSVIASSSSTSVSGSHIDSLLFHRVVDQFKKDVGIDLSIDHMASYRILDAVEVAKIELSSRRTTDINLPFITANQTGAKHLVHKLSTYDLDRILEQPAKEATSLCDAVLKDAGLRKEQIGLLVLIGGGVRSAHLRSELERFFKLRAFTSKNFSPEEAVVVGATEFGRRLVLEDD